MKTLDHQRNRRRDIQIYRGIAVLAVILFHVGMPFMGSGYLGVDAFFVISGYVMMPRIQSLLNDGNQGLTKNVSKFFKMRLARLAPSAGVTIGLSVPLLLLFGLPGDFHRISRQAIASILLVGNLGAYRYSGSSYFNPNPNPLVHTWSLSVEEQIYLVIPLIVITIYYFSKKNKTSLIVQTLTLVSFSTELFLSATTIFSNKVVSIENLIFYSPFTRIWQFGFGCLFFIHAKKLSSRGCRLTLIISMLMSSQFHNIFPQNTWICLLIGLLLSQELKFMGSSHLNSLVWLGDRSYSLYLVHMPAMYLVDASLFANTIPRSSRDYLRMGGALVVVLFLAILLYEYVESRLRKTYQHVSFKHIFTRTSLVPLVSILTCTFIFNSILPGYGNNIDLLGERQISAAESRGCVNTGFTPTKCTWEFGTNGNILLLGDSQAWSYSDGVIESAKKIKSRVVVSSMDHCLFIGTKQSFLIDSKVSNCALWQEHALKYILTSKPNLVILANRGDGWIKPGFGEPVDNHGNIIYESETLFAEYERVLRDLTAKLRLNGVPLMIIAESAWTPDVFDSNLFTHMASNLETGFERGKATEGGIRTLNLYTQIASEMEAVVYEPNEVLCVESRCPYYKNSKRLYWNHDHISVNASLLLSESLSKEIVKSQRRQ
jgi:peptidoglycan/LPS O-acetylase OafA/YrhL